MWTRQTLTPANRGPYSGIGERISFGGVAAPGFALAAPGDPEVWTKLSAAQQDWVMRVIVELDAYIRETTNTTCPTWGPSITATAGCFQKWFNANTKGMYTGADGKPIVLRTDGVFDQSTLDALITVAGTTNPQKYAVDPFPGDMQIEKKEGLSKGAIVGIAAAGALVLGGGLYIATRKKSRRR